MLQIQEPRASSILESHGKPVRHDLFVAIGRFDALLIELQELRGVGGTVVARRQIRLELARPGDATQLGSEGAAASRGCRGQPRWWTLVLTRCVLHHCRWCTVLTRWHGECRCSFSQPRNFLAASLFTRGRRTRRVASWSHASVTPLMRLYLPRVEARLRGIIALKAYVASEVIFTTTHVIHKGERYIVGLQSPLHTIHKYSIHHPEYNQGPTTEPK